MLTKRFSVLMNIIKYTCTMLFICTYFYLPNASDERKPHTGAEFHKKGSMKAHYLWLYGHFEMK